MTEPSGTISKKTVLYLVTPQEQSVACGIRRAVAEVGPGGRVVVLYVHDPAREEDLSEALSSGAFVGLKQVRDVAEAAWRSAEAGAAVVIEEARKVAEAAGVETLLETARGPLCTVVEELVQTYDVQAVILCRPKGSLLARFFLPKTARQLKRELRVPLIEVEPAPGRPR